MTPRKEMQMPWKRALTVEEAEGSWEKVQLRKRVELPC